MGIHVCLLLISALVHVTAGDVLAVGVGSDVIIKDSTVVTRTPCGEPTSYVPTGATFDPKNYILYWTGRRQSWVGVANMDMGVAKLQRKIYTDIISDGYDIDFDVTSGLLYVAANEGIIVMDTNGTESVQIIQNGKPHTVAVDPIGRHLYWSDSEARVIWRANLDGSHHHAVYIEAERTTSIAVDVPGRRLYWAAKDTIYSLPLNGSELKTSRVPLQEKIVRLAVRGDSIYYATNWRVFRVSKRSVLAGDLHQDAPSMITRADCMELHTLAVHSPDPIKSNVSQCEHKNGGCYKLCIPLRDGITCASKREIMHVPDKMEAPPLPTRSDVNVDGDDYSSEDYSSEMIDILYDKEAAQMKIAYPVIVVIVVILTCALIIVIVCYWKRARKDQSKKLIWDIQSITDFKPGEPGLRFYMEDDILDDVSIDSKSMRSVHA